MISLADVVGAVGGAGPSTNDMACDVWNADAGGGGISIMLALGAGGGGGKADS